MTKNVVKGFTLIELLVVIAVIGLLASIVLVSLGRSRAKARDSRRQADVRQLSTAMELYYGDNGDKYLISATLPLAVGGYMPKMPQDPLNSGANVYNWLTNMANAQKYCFYAVLEVPASTTYVCASNAGVFSSATTPTLNNCCY